MAVLIQFENPEVVEAIEARFDAMTVQVGMLHLEIPAEFIAWQTEDMNRRVPNIEEADEGQWLKKWLTRIWPRSRRSDKASKYRRQRGRRARPKRSVFSTRGVGGGTRPILRQELFDMLNARMRKLLDKVSWKAD